MSTISSLYFVYFVRARRFIGFLGLLFLIQSCSTNTNIVASHLPSIEQDPSWKMIEVCGYEPCQPVAALKGKDIIIRVEPQTGTREEKVFTIDLTLSSKVYGQYEFNPSLSIVTLSNNRVLPAKGTKCNLPHIIHHYKNALRNAEAIKSPQSLGNYNCYTLFFEAYPPSDTEEFMLEINGLTKRGDKINIPSIYFRPRTSP